MEARPHQLELLRPRLAGIDQGVQTRSLEMIGVRLGMSFQRDEQMRADLVTWGVETRQERRPPLRKKPARSGVPIYIAACVVHCC